MIKGINNEVITELDNKYEYFYFIPGDNLIAYGIYLDNRVEYGYLDIEGNQLTETNFYTNRDGMLTPASFRGKETMMLKTYPNNFGVVNRDFETIIPFEYPHIRIINKKYIVGKKNDETFLFDTYGNLLSKEIPEMFNGYGFEFKGKNGIAYFNNKSYVIDEEGNEIECFKGYDIICFRGRKTTCIEFGNIILKNDESKYGLLSLQCEETLPIIHDELLFLSENLVLAKKRGALLHHRFKN